MYIELDNDQNVIVCNWQHIRFVWWTCFSTESWNSYGHQLCSSSRLHWWRAEFMQGFLKKNKIRNIDDDLSLTSKCGENVDRIWYNGHKIKDSRDTARSGSCIDLHLRADRERKFIREMITPRISYGRHHNLVNRYGMSVSHITTDIFRLP
jgi:hypothetical protein